MSWLRRRATMSFAIAALLCREARAAGPASIAELAGAAQAAYDAKDFEKALAGYDAAVEQARAAKDPELARLLGRQRIAAGVLATERLKARHATDALPLYEKALAISREL